MVTRLNRLMTLMSATRKSGTWSPSIKMAQNMCFTVWTTIVRSGRIAGSGRSGTAITTSPPTSSASRSGRTTDVNTALNSVSCISSRLFKSRSKEATSGTSNQVPGWVTKTLRTTPSRGAAASWLWMRLVSLWIAQLYTQVKTNGPPSRTVTGLKSVIRVTLLARVMSRTSTTTHPGAIIPTTKPTVTLNGSIVSYIWSISNNRKGKKLSNWQRRLPSKLNKKTKLQKQQD